MGGMGMLMSLMEAARPRGGIVWTADLKKILTEKLAEHKSATVIAAEMRKHGIYPSRNAIIGILHRMNAGHRFASKIVGNDARERSAPRIKPRRDSGMGTMRSIDRRLYVGNLPLPKPKISAAPFLGLTLVQLEPNQCRYPRGEEKILFCGQPTKKDSSYCPHCHDLTRWVRA